MNSPYFFKFAILSGIRLRDEFAGYDLPFGLAGATRLEKLIRFVYG